MKEIGGYLELDTYSLTMLHDGAIALNSGRNCLAYLIKKKNIKKIWLPKFLCASVWDVCKKLKVEIHYYSIDMHFLPVLESTDDWVYLVNYYGQLSNSKILELQSLYPSLIVDNVQAYFQSPINGIDTIYTCRKFFGVTDGAFLYSNIDARDLGIDESFERLHFVLGRFERSASEFYNDFREEEDKIGDWDILKMSKLTNNLLHAIDYVAVEEKRIANFAYLHDKLSHINKLALSVPVGAYMYPLHIDNGDVVRKKLQANKIFIPTLWPDVFEICSEDELEYDMANNILPIPVDQRYGIEDMEYIVKKLEEILYEH